MTDRAADPEPATRVMPESTGFTIRPVVLWGMVIVLGLMAWLVPWTSEQVRSSVVRAAEPYTALAFADPVAPVDCARGLSVVSVSNQLGRDHVYTYTVTVTRDDGRVFAGPSRGRLAVASGRTATVQVGAGVPLPAAARLDVVLSGGSEKVSARCGRSTR
jgi:hypothetical protein